MWWIDRQHLGRGINGETRFLVSIKAIASAVWHGVVHATSHMTASRLGRLRNLTAVSDMSGKDGEVDLRGGAAAKTGWAEPAHDAADRMMGVSAELAIHHRWRRRLTLVVVSSEMNGTTNATSCEANLSYIIGEGEPIWKANIDAIQIVYQKCEIQGEEKI
uniref:Uncharacterized protein n=1 Tax=Oryza glumipatula TaxID=40148 RepID=A0A0E0AAX4_9ORYZ